MRAGLSTIQQTLTPEAASVLNQSISEAAKRNHGHTTPLHVAATLLGSPSGFLRQACIRSHPNSSHPLQCRALELCFSVALDRVPTAQNMASGAEPPINNALMAALKRAQAHQRRGCPENQQQPLLAVKVELEQLIISILDDPSVSRVMREASFSSPAVKAMIEQSLNSTSNSNSLKQSLLHGNGNLGTFVGLGPRLVAPPSSNLGNSNILSVPDRNTYVNPKLKQGPGGGLGSQRNDEVKKVFDIMMKSKKKNPVLVGDSEPEGLVKELLRRIEKGELTCESESERSVKNSQIISVGKELPLDQINVRIKELGSLIESRMKGNGGIIIDLGDLKWLVELSVTFGNSCGVLHQQQQQGVSEAGRLAVAEISNLLARFAKIGKVWLIGSATCESYMRCQVYHPTMENDWDLQALPIASRSPVQGILSRLGTERNLSNTRSLNPIASLQTAVPALTRRLSENEDPSRKVSCCPRCSQKYEEELSVMTKELENLSSENKSEATRTPLPQWLQHAKVHNGGVKVTDQSNEETEPLLKQKTQELQRKWTDVCLNLHPSFHKILTSERMISPSVPAMRSNITSDRIASPAVPAMSLINPKLLLKQPSQPKPKPAYILGDMLQFNTTPATMQPSQCVNSPSASPVRTELALGRKVSGPSEKMQEVGENGVKDFLGCISMEPQKKLIEKFASTLDADSFKKILKGLMERAWWQPEAASGVASAVTRCRLGNGKRRGSMSKGDIWLLFTGPDRVGKRKMASVLSQHICGTSPVIVSLGSRRDDEEQDTNFRGKTVLDRIVEAVRRNPFSVIMLEDIDEVDLIMRGNIKRAMERGRLTDSHGREVSLGNVIFILTGNWSTMEYGQSLEEKKLACNASSNWQLKLAISNGQKNAKRRAIWMENAERPTKPRKEPNFGLSFDLNQAVDEDDDRTDGSHNSSDLTVGHEEDLGLETGQFAIASVPIELINSADDAIVFKPVDFSFVRSEIKKTISVKFSMAVDDSISIQVDDDVLDKVLAALWLGRCSLEEWVEKALAPSFEQLKNRAPDSIESSSIIQLLVEQSSYFESRRNGDLLPSKVRVMVDGAEI